jgi:DNA-binding LytR/AlgR family response regulator
MSVAPFESSPALEPASQRDLPAAASLPRLRALVVEDEWPARNYLVELLEGSGLAEVVGAVGDAEAARQAILDHPRLPLDAVFIDVHLHGDGDGDRAGLDLVRALSAIPDARAPMFVLATAFDRHALEAYDLGVIDYLLKPFTEERVAQCVRRLAARRAPVLAVPPPMRIVARRKKNLVFLDPPEIWAFEAADRLTFVHARRGKFDLELSLAAIEASFGRTLTRVHRNWLVNAAYIKELERDGSETRLFVGTTDGDEERGVRVPVSRDRAQPIREMLLAGATGLRRS